jgi:Protein of unknown function (DUF2927).
MPYLICKKCGGYYQLQGEEAPDDFHDKCQCGGDLEYLESLEGDSSIGLESLEGDSSIGLESLEGDSSIGLESLEEPPNNDDSILFTLKNNKRFSSNLFRISLTMGVIVILIISMGLITAKNDHYGVFNFNVYEKYSNEEINTFMESAFSPDDYGNRYDKVGKWNINVVRIRVVGSPTSEDLKTLNNAINDINTNVKDFQLKIDDKNQLEPDMEIYFVPHSEFTRYSVNPAEVDGFTEWKVSTSGIYGGNSAGEIFKSRIFIGIDGLSQERRSHVIVHELAHGLGLHHNHNQNSVLCINGPDLTEFSDLDKTMIRILYRKDLQPFMSQNQVEIILNNSRGSIF